MFYTQRTCFVVAVDEFYEISNKIPAVYIALNNRTSMTHDACKNACLERRRRGLECYGAARDSDNACLINHRSAMRNTHAQTAKATVLVVRTESELYCVPSSCCLRSNNELRHKSFVTYHYLVSVSCKFSYIQ